MITHRLDASCPSGFIRACTMRGVPLIQVYGATETCPIATYMRADDAMRKAGSAGRARAALRSARRRRRRRATWRRCQHGEILVRGPNVMSGYWNAPQATRRGFRGGWFHSGDIGHFDDEGYLYVVGRAQGHDHLRRREHLSRPRSRTCCSSAPRSPRPAWSAGPMRAGAKRWSPSSCPSPAHADARPRCSALFDGRARALTSTRRTCVFVDALPRSALGKVRKDDVRRLVGRTRR